MTELSIKNFLNNNNIKIHKNIVSLYLQKNSTSYLVNSLFIKTEKDLINYLNIKKFNNFYFFKLLNKNNNLFYIRFISY